MRKFTFIVSAALLLAGGSRAEAQTIGKKLFKQLAAERVKAAKTQQPELLKRSPKAAQGSKWKIAKEEEFYYDGGDWLHSAYYYYTYDNEGRVLVNTSEADGFYSKRTNTYDSDGRIVHQEDADSEDGTTYVVSVKRDIEYDDIVKDLIIKREAFSLDETTGELTQPGNNYTYDVKRNEAGNVVSTQRAVWYDGAYDPTERATVTYDEATGKAVGYDAEILQSDESGSGFVWAEDSRYKNIVWDRTDGQLVGGFSTWYEGANRVKSAVLYTIGSAGTKADLANVSVEYKEGGSYAVTIAQGDAYKAVLNKTFTDQYGSYDVELTEMQDFNGDGQFGDDEKAVTQKEVYGQDSHGNMTLLESYEYDETTGQLSLISKDVSEYTYDPERDEVSQIVMSSYNADTGEMEPMLKYVTLEYTDVTSGIELQKTEEGQNKAFYNVQGMKLDNNAASRAKGLYFEKIGGKAYKVLK